MMLTPFDHQPRQYSAAHEDAVIDDLRRAAANDDVEQAPDTFEMTKWDVILSMGAAFLMGVFVAMQIGV